MKIYVIGLGPGGMDQLTPRAREAILASDCIVGYPLYLSFIATMLTGKKIIATGMTREVERCRQALDEALQGKTVAVVSSGDAGIYGMAGLMCEVCEDTPDIQIEIIPGITAACSGAAVLGAPLTHDFAVISLSDLLTPWDLIEKRLMLAAQGDFTICIYNPSSKTRIQNLKKACDIILNYRSNLTPCGIVRNIGRAEEAGQIVTLTELRNISVDMLTTVFIGNSQTKVIRNRLVTPRGYQKT